MTPLIDPTTNQGRMRWVALACGVPYNVTHHQRTTARGEHPYTRGMGCLSTNFNRRRPYGPVWPVIANMWKGKDRICLLALMSYWYYKGHQSVNSDNRWCPHFWHNLLLQVRHCLCEDTASWMDLRVITESLFYILPFCIVMVGYSILWALYCTTSIKITFMSSSYLLFLFRGFPPLRRSDVSDHFFFTAACALFWPNEVYGTPPHCHSFFWSGPSF